MSEFDDLFTANDNFVTEFKSQDLTGAAKKGLAIITCMDSRIDPLRIVGMKAGGCENFKKCWRSSNRGCA
jgi:carbonic anhydrase